jgi:ADP-heptose:LPS heptosyltransferase
MTRALLYCAGGGIGDSLVASVVGRALRGKYDVVDALTLPGHSSTLERVPDLDGVLVDDGGDEIALAASLRERDYDACVVTWATARTARVPKLAKIAARVGQSRRLYSGAFTKRVFVRSERGDVISPWADILLDYARALGCDTNDVRPKFVPTADDEREASLVIPSVTSGASVVEGPYIILHPTNAIASKRGIWPTQGWAALARALADAFGATVLLSGAPADAAINEAIVRQVQSERIVDIAGKLSIGGFGALAQRARGFVGITTGTMHVAAAVGAPTLGIFPFQSDFPERWGPLGERTAVVRASYPCHPGDTKEHCRDYACIANLDVERILAAAAALIGGNSGLQRHDTTVHV